MKNSLLIIVFFFALCSCAKKQKEPKPLNILFAISDDQSFKHTGFAGCKFINTPAFDRIASEGVYFENCYAGSPGCAPSRSAIVTGRYHWQNEEAGQHACFWNVKYVPFIDILDNNGYVTGLTGKGVGPFRYAKNESETYMRKTNAGGRSYSEIKYTAENDDRPAKEINDLNYFENFKYFMENVRGDKPFFFWYGGHEPHRPFEYGSWKHNGKALEKAVVPKFLPDAKVTREDVLDYAVEIEWFDTHLQRMLTYLEEIGELDNTLVIVTSDNGMAFPRAKANAYNYGIHIPFAIRCPQAFEGGRIIEDLISFTDIAPTLLELTNISSEGMMPISGKSFLNILQSKKEGKIDKNRRYAFSGRERHSASRYKNRGYPQRAICSDQYLFIWNIKPERYPSGAPQRLKEQNDTGCYPIYGIDEDGVFHSEWAFTDIDESPSKSYVFENMNTEEGSYYYNITASKRPEFELYDIKNDAACLHNLYDNSEFGVIQKEMKQALFAKLKETEDPRVVGKTKEEREIFDSYHRYSSMRYFPKPELD